MQKATKKTSKGSRRSSSVVKKAVKPIELPDGMWERISHKAYELWEERGRQEGGALRDWLDAEEIVMTEIHEARE
ncbi:MAG: DUF2934 domain-containing protein [Nitrospira sp.]|jgi:hypothetical protein|nr:DUF2934 domain-containing protein [Nitrospira sp. BO4]